MKMESAQGGSTNSLGDFADAIADALNISRDLLEAAQQRLETGLKLLGVSTPAAKLIRDLNKYSEKPVLSWFLKLPMVKMLQVAMVAGQIISAGPAKAEDFSKAMQTTYQLTQATQKMRSQEAAQDLKSSEAPDKQLQNFLSAIQDPVKALRSEFGSTTDPVKYQAWRFAVANILISYKNRIEREQLQKVPEYHEKIQEVFGVPEDVVDLYGKDAEYKKDYPLFKETLFKIYASKDFAQLQHVVEDDRILFHYEVLDRANADHPGSEEFRKNNIELVSDAVAYFKKDKNLEKVIGYVAPEMIVPDDARRKNIPLDIPEKLMS